jgi:hypothetical protein
VDIITKQQARDLGLTRYFTGKTCKNGHIAERQVTGRCVACHKDFYDNHPEKWQNWRNLNLEENKKHSRELSRLWRERAPEKMLLGQIKSRCKRKNIICTITVDDIKFPTHCPILGIELFVGTGMGPVMNGPSVDRIIPELGYVPGNVHVVSRLANTMKNMGTLEECVKLGEWAQREINRRDNKY